MGNLSFIRQLQHVNFALFNVGSSANKSLVFNDLFSSYNSDFLLLTET